MPVRPALWSVETAACIAGCQPRPSFSERPCPKGTDSERTQCLNLAHSLWHVCPVPTPKMHYIPTQDRTLTIRYFSSKYLTSFHLVFGRQRLLTPTLEFEFRRDQGRGALKTMYEPAIVYSLAQKTDVSHITDGTT